MTLRNISGQSFGDNHEDLRTEIADYSEVQGTPAAHFVDMVCSCSNKTFHLYSDEDVGVGVRVCATCELDHYIGDSEEYIDDEDTELRKRICTCGTEIFEISVAVSLYRDSEDVRWVYIGCRCPTCGLLGVYSDWKVEFSDYRRFLAMG